MKSTIERAYLRLVLLMAPSFQGGHSKTGGEVADLLGIPFPLDIKNLSRVARENGFNPDELWPWRTQMKREAADMFRSQKGPIVEDEALP
jgi:transposase-like protein